jgi:signal peptidase II
LSTKSWRFWPILLTVVMADCASKRAAEARLEPATPHPVAGEVVRLTLGYNRGAAFGIDLGGDRGRWVLVLLSGTALAILLGLYRRAHVHDTRLATAVALVAGGALGNMLDRILSPQGVVDFIDVGIGSMRFWTFNVADMGISAGAILLAAALWRRSQEAEPGVS